MTTCQKGVQRLVRGVDTNQHTCLSREGLMLSLLDGTRMLEDAAAAAHIDMMRRRTMMMMMMMMMMIVVHSQRPGRAACR
jgi:hypothetical protein